MKKLIIFLILGLIPLYFLISNPVVLPQAFISELKFENNNEWTLEITFLFSEPYLKEKYDSICIETLSGLSRVRLDYIEDSTSLFVITADSLISPLTINRDGDKIKLYSYISHYQRVTDSLIIGSYPGSVIDYLPDDYSIARISYLLFAKDKSPTIGFENDTIGTCGTLTGFMYDKYDSLVTEGNFKLDNEVYFNNDGTFWTSVYSREVAFNLIWNNYEPGKSQMVSIDTIHLNFDPEQLYINDIHAVTDIISDLDYEKNENLEVINISNYPNPFNSTTNFVLRLPVELQAEEKEINIYNVTGETILTIKCVNNNVSWDGRDIRGNHFPSGIYYYQLVINSKVYANGKLIMLK